MHVAMRIANASGSAPAPREESAGAERGVEGGTAREHERRERARENVADHPRLSAPTRGAAGERGDDGDQEDEGGGEDDGGIVTWSAGVSPAGPDASRVRRRRDAA